LPPNLNCLTQDWVLAPDRDWFFLAPDRGSGFFSAGWQNGFFWRPIAERIFLAPDQHFGASKVFSAGTKLI